MNSKQTNYLKEIEHPETGELVEVQCYVHGEFSKQSLYSPAETPEVDILSALPEGIDPEELIHEIIQDLWEQKERDEFEEEYGDLRYDRP